MEAPFAVKTDSFEGPLEILLSLVEKHKMHPSDVPLAAIAEEYIEYVRGRAISPEKISEFILIAATLMLIKSRALLPHLSLTRDEEASIEELEGRVKEYQKIQQAAQHLKKRLSTPGHYIRLEHKRSADPTTALFRAPTKNPLKEHTLRDTLKKLHAAIPTALQIPQTIVKKIRSLEEVLTELLARVMSDLKTNLREFAGRERESIILTFLALLELSKQGSVHITQQSDFGEIEIEATHYDTPRYV